MSDDATRARLIAHIEAWRRQSPLEAATNFCHGYCSDALGREEIRQDMLRMMQINTASLFHGLAGIEALLAVPPSDEGTLIHLVLWDANQGIDNLTTEGAKVWLAEMAELIRDVLDDKQPARDFALPWFQRESMYTT